MQPGPDNVWAVWSAQLALAETRFPGGLAFCTFDAACGPAEAAVEPSAAGGASYGWGGELGGVWSPQAAAFGPFLVDRAQGLSESFLERVGEGDVRWRKEAANTAVKPLSARGFLRNRDSESPSRAGTGKSDVTEGAAAPRASTSISARPGAERNVPKHNTTSRSRDSERPARGEGQDPSIRASSTVEQSDAWSAAGSDIGESRSGGPSDGRGVSSPRGVRAAPPAGGPPASEAERVLLDALARATELERRIAPPAQRCRAEILRDLGEVEELLTRKTRARCRSPAKNATPSPAHQVYMAGKLEQGALGSRTPWAPVSLSPPPTMSFPSSLFRQTGSDLGGTRSRSWMADSWGLGAGPSSGAGRSPLGEFGSSGVPSFPGSISPSPGRASPEHPQVDLEALETLRPSPSPGSPERRPVRPQSPKLSYNAAKRALRGSARGAARGKRR